MKKVVLAYSGGLDTSVCIPLLKEEYGYDHVVTVAVDVGQPDIAEAEKKARAIADEHYTVDARRQFVDEYVFPLIKANGSYEGYVLGTAIARPLIAEKVVEVAEQVGAVALAHGCTGKGNDQLRFEAKFRLAGLDVVAPMREMKLTREWEIEYAREHAIPVPATKEKPWSVDENLWSRSIEGGVLEEPGCAPPEEIYGWTSDPTEDARAEEMTITFEKGTPTAIDDKQMEPVALVKKLNELGGRHGVGRTDMMEDRVLGLKARENYEHPAATILLTAHRDLELLTLTYHQLKLKALIEQQWAELAYYGLVDEPLFDDLNAFIDSTQRFVSGWVRLRLYSGSCTVVARDSPHALYNREIVSFDTAGEQDYAEGFSVFHSMQAKLARRRED
ncbi:MAG: argininosuccinate synthase [Methermicoccaceae archaeon]